MKIKYLLLLSFTLKLSFTFASSVDCYNFLSTLPIRGYNLPVAKKSGFLLAAKRADNRGFYIVGKQSVRWVNIPTNEYTSWKAIQIQGIDNLIIHAKYTDSESYLTTDDEAQMSQYTEKQLKTGQFLKLKAVDIQQNDKEYQSVLQENLNDRFKSLLVAKFAASEVANLAKKQMIQNLSPIQRQSLISQLEFSSNSSIAQLIKACEGQGISEVHVSELRKMKPELLSAFQIVAGKVNSNLSPPDASKSQGVRN